MVNAGKDCVPSELLFHGNSSNLADTHDKCDLLNIWLTDKSYCLTRGTKDTCIHQKFKRKGDMRLIPIKRSIRPFNLLLHLPIIFYMGAEIDPAVKTRSSSQINIFHHMGAHYIQVHHATAPPSSLDRSCFSNQSYCLL
jgi:hypothetical protein